MANKAENAKTVKLSKAAKTAKKNEMAKKA